MDFHNIHRDNYCKNAYPFLSTNAQTLLLQYTEMEQLKCYQIFLLLIVLGNEMHGYGSENKDVQRSW